MKNKINRIVIVLFFISSVFFYFFLKKIATHFEGYIQTNLPIWIAKATQGNYQITYEKIQVNPITRKVTVAHVHIFKSPNYSSSATIDFDLNAPLISLSIVRLSKLDKGKTFKCSSILIDNPKIIIHSFLKSTVQDSTTVPVLINKIPLKNKNSLIELSTQLIEIKKPIIYYTFKSKDNSYEINGNGGTILLKNCDYKPFERHDSTWFYYAQEADIHLLNCRYNSPNNFYNFLLDKFHFNSKSQQVVFKNLAIKPNVSPTKIYASLGYQTNIYTANLPSIIISNLNWEHWIRNHELLADKLDLDSSFLSIYLSRIPPPNIKNRMGNAPPQLLQKIKMPITINQVNFKNTQLGYTEESRKTYQPATIYFSNIESHIYQLSNAKELIKKQPNCIATFQGLFMNRSNIDAWFVFPMNDTQAKFQMATQIKQVNAEQLSAQAKNWALAEITSLLVENVDFIMQGNEDSANIKFGMAYKNLKIKLYKVDSNTHEMQNRRWVSLIANNVMLYPKNPLRGDTLRTVNFSLIRDKTKPFFTYLWNGLYAGILETVVRNDDLAQIIKLKIRNKVKRDKTHFFRVFRKNKT